MKNLESQAENLGLDFGEHKKTLWALELRSDSIKIVAIIVGFNERLEQRD